MSKLTDYAVEIFVWGIGWLVCFCVLAGAYGFGVWAAPHLGWTRNPDYAGILSAITVLWIYEHRNIEAKYNRLLETLEQRGRN